MGVDCLGAAPGRLRHQDGPGPHAIATWDDVAHQLVNVWIDRHETGHLATCRPVVVLALWEHAFSVYLEPTQRAQYLDDFFANVDWDTIGSRLK